MNTATQNTFTGNLSVAIVFAIVLLGSFTVIIAPAHAGSTYLFYDSFEDGTFNKWTGTYPTKPEYVQWSVTDTTAHEGFHSAQMALYTPPPSGKYAWGGYYVDIPFEASGSREAYWRAWVKFNELPARESEPYTELWIKAKGPPPWTSPPRAIFGEHMGVGVGIKKGATQVHIKRYYPSPEKYDVPYPFERNRWYLIEMSVKRAVDGWYKAWVNGELVFSEYIDTSKAPELGAASIVTSALFYQSYPGYTWFDECLASNSHIGLVPAAPTVVSCDDTGNLKDTFYPGETVYVKGSGLEHSKIYPVHVVYDVETWTNGMSIPSRVPGTEETITSNSNGMITPTSIWSLAVPGKYDLVIDVNGNGLYEIGVDSLDQFDATGFFVVPELPLGTITALSATFIPLVLTRARPRRNKKAKS